MQRLVEIIQGILKGMYTRKIIHHCHEGVIKKITKEEMIEKFYGYFKKTEIIGHSKKPCLEHCSCQGFFFGKLKLV